MMEQVTLFQMFPDYEPPEALGAALSQAAIVAADILPEERSVRAALHHSEYIPQRLLNQAGKEIAALYGLRRLELTATHPEDQLHRVEPEELMELFVSRNSMTRGSLAGAKWRWEGTALTIQLAANGKRELEELIPQVQTVLRERFAAPVTITVEAGEPLEGKALFDAMDAMRQNLLGSLPSGGGGKSGGKPTEAKAAPPSEAFYGKPFRGTPVSMKDLSLDMGTVIVEGKVFNIDHKELKKRNAWVVKFDMTDNTNSVRISRFLEAGEAKPILDNVKLGAILRVQGKPIEDRFENELVLKPYAMMPGAMEKRKDTAPNGKRVELHLHTNMSQMDGMTPAKTLVERAIRWGREYHEYLQKHLALGLREKTAKSAARRDFIAAHPRPKNADDLIRTDEFPGLSTPSLRRYHNAYLHSLTEIVPQA